MPVLYMRMWPRINDILTGNLLKMNILQLCKLRMMLITGVHCSGFKGRLDLDELALLLMTS